MEFDYRFAIQAVFDQTAFLPAMREVSGVITN
jgi:hypothetical protein